MDKIKVSEIKDKNEWEDFVLKQKPKSFLHSWNWGEVQLSLGNKIFRKGFFSKGKLLGASLFIGQDAKRGSHLIVPGGPILDWSNKGLVSSWLGALQDISKKENYWFIRVRPELLNTKENENMFKKLGFINSPMHLHSENTWVLDITKSEEELLSGMRKNTRYMVRKALSSDLIVETTKDVGKVDILYKLQEETVKRHGFVGFSKKLFRAQIEHFGKDNQTDLYLIKKGEEILLAAIIIFYGDFAYYHHSASSERSRKYPASYLLQWQVIKDARERGLSFYNFWGIAPKDRKDHRFSGVTIFKKGFGGERVDWLHAMDFPISNKYYLTNAFERLRRKSRNL